MNNANNIANNLMQYSSAGGTLAAAIGYRVLSTIVDLDVSSTSSPSSLTEEEQGVGNSMSASGVKSSTSILGKKDWFWRNGSSSPSSATQQYSSAIGFDRDSSLPLFTLQQVSYHDMRHDCWIILYDRVYNVTSFLSSHPGGDEVMMEYAGLDATLAFRGVGHSEQAEESLKPYLVGILVESERIWTRFFNMKSDIPWTAA